ncbi:MAG: hypothetical protein KGY50_04710, partial [Candidatus Thermoplasmatota archaeon]|nr:hypothetical protein [Candidatus Thermoplasmatota archaeon]
MNRRNKWKIGLSLLVAMCFIIPTGIVAADESFKIDAELDQQLNINDKDWALKVNDDLQPAAGGTVSINGAVFESPDGQQLQLDPNDVIPVEDFYKIYAQMALGGTTDPTSLAKPHLELYELSKGEEIMMYETSFEDNFDIYNNWVQIDEDCAMNGYYDSFSWSDARSSDGDHSMKSTMYETYKGNQDDYLQCTKTFDVSDQQSVKFSFDIWVEGQWDDPFGLYSPYDFLSFDISDNFLSTLDLWVNPSSNGLAPGGVFGLAHQGSFVNDEGGEVFDNMFFAGASEDGLGPQAVQPDPYLIYGAYYFPDTTVPLYSVGPEMDYTPKATNLGDGWWNVEYEVKVSQLEAFGFDTQNMMFRFDWHTDPEFQYEGAYVDNVQVISIENQVEKIFQSHSQGPVEVGNFAFEFPLDWQTVEKGCYKLKLWVEGIDCASDNDWPDYVEIDFCVEDVVDCAIDETGTYLEDSFNQQPLEMVEDPDGNTYGLLEQGDDLHIPFCVESIGNVPVDEIPVKATAKKLMWEESYSTDFEGLPWGDSGSFGGPNLWHLTDYDSWSGSKSFACFDKDTKHYHNDMYVN